MVIFLHPPLFSIQGLKKKKTPPLKDCKKRASQIFLQTLRILLSETFLNENISSKKLYTTAATFPSILSKNPMDYSAILMVWRPSWKKSLSGSGIFGDFLYVIKHTLYCPNLFKKPFCCNCFGVRVLFIINTLN